MNTGRSLQRLAGELLIARDRQSAGQGCSASHCARSLESPTVAGDARRLVVGSLLRHF